MTRAFAVVQDLLLIILCYVMVRPLAIVFVYCEQLALVLFHSLDAMTSCNNRPSALRRMYHSLRNLVSLRLFLRLLFSSRIPINEGRLHSTSASYRLLKPFVFPPAEHKRKIRKFQVAAHYVPPEVVEIVEKGVIFNRKAH